VAFPLTPLPISVEISLDSTTWTDITSDVRSDSQIQISRGRSDWGQQTDPARCSFSLDNRDGKYSPRNPESPYYGQIGRNTPVRVSVETGSVACWLPGRDSNDSVGTPDAAALDITGDIDVRLDAKFLNWYMADTALGAGVTSSLTELFGKWTESGNQRSWVLYSQIGYLEFAWTTDGTSGTMQTAVSTAKISMPSSGRLAVRVTLDVNNGSGGWTARFYTSDSISGTWTQLGDAVTGVGVTSIYSSSSTLNIGSAIQGTAWDMPLGHVYGAQVRNGIGGTVVANPDFTAQASGTTSFADSAGRTWTVAGNTEITNRKVRFVGEISSWTPKWDTGGHDVITEVEASGLLRRLTQGAIAAKSPMYREFTSPFRTHIVAYWPMEDAAGATTLASGLDGYPAMKITGSVTPAGYDDWSASDPIPTIGTGSLKGTVPTYTATNFVFLRFFAAVPAAGVASTQRLLSFTQTGTAKTWSLYLTTAGSLELRAYDNDSTQILAPGAFAFAINGDRKSIGIELTQDGADIDWTVFVYDVTDSTLTTSSGLTTSGTLAGYTVGRVTEVRLGEDGLMNNTAVGHIAVSDSSSGFASTGGALIGWNGETAAARVHRLGIEEDILAFSTSPGDQQMGVQTRSTVIELMRDAEDVDQGILCEQRDVLGIRHVQRTSLYNQTPALVLDYTGSDGLVAPLDPVDDDQNVTNDVTVQREGGSSARTTLTSGALSTQAPPDGIGLYDTSQTFHLFSDDQPTHHSGWLLHRGTWDETRFPQVTVDLSNAPESIDDAAACDTGSRIQITNPPQWLPPGTIDLLVHGYSEVMDQYTWKITYNCTPFGPYNVAYEATAGESIYGRADTDGSELAEALTTTETDVDVQVTSGPQWVIAAPNMLTNYDFSTDLTGWFGDGCTITRVTTPGLPPFSADWSLKMVPDGVATFPNAGSDLVAVTVGKQYTASGWQMCATSRTIELNINWFDVGQNYLSTSSTGIAVTADTWTWFEGTATAPASAVYANMSPTVSSTPPSTDVVHANMLTLRPAIDDDLPQEFPFDVLCGGEIMRVTACTRSVYDTFARTAASGWGSADSGQAYTVVGTAADYAVGSGYGSMTFPTTGVAHLALATGPSADIDMLVDVTTSATATGASIFAGPLIRAADNNNHYMCRLEFTTGNVINASLRKRVAGVETSLATYTVPFAHVAGTFVRVRFQVIGSTIRARVWAVTGTEPGDWNMTTTDTAITSASNVGFRGFSNTGNTNVNPQARFDNFKVLNPQTFTVTRSVNGVSKTHSSGTDLSLAYPSITAL
jgi:hypothetical protein